ncbi:MAG: signal peptidase I [Spirochaetes bacterium]|nr:signal peptidase I [Spirochaetota bacterium]
MKNLRNIFQAFHNVFSSILIAAIIAVILRIFFISVFYIPSSSMEKILKIGDYVMVWKFLYDKKIPVINTKLPFGFRIKRGDVVVFIPVNNPHEYYIKRCIGLEGEKIMFYRNDVYINDVKLEEPYVKDKPLITYHQRELDVPRGHIFVMGDNRLTSSDSRDWGSVSTDHVTGKALFVFFPFNRIRIIK